MPSCSPASSRSWAAAISSSGIRAVDVHPGAAGAHEVVRAEEVLACSHRRPEHVDLLPPEAVELAGGFGPLVAPQTTTLPAGADRVERARPRRLADRLDHDVDALAGGLLDRGDDVVLVWLTATSAPHSRAAASFSALPEVTIVRRRGARQSSKAAVATPPPIPQISAHWPSWMPARVTSIR